MSKPYLSAARRFAIGMIRIHKRALAVGVVSVCTILFFTTGCSTIESKSEIDSSETNQNCTPGYSPCLPRLYDYDCKTGKGDGPGFTGKVKVTGNDPYDLDRDGDGIGCNS